MASVLLTRVAVIVVASALTGAGVEAETRPIDVARSTLTISVYKSGLFSAFADNHVIRAPISNGHVTDDRKLGAEVAVHAADLMVLDPSLPVEKRAEIAVRMHGKEVLDTAKYPEIVFASTALIADGADRWQMTGVLTLHGVSRSVTGSVVLQNGHYQGTLSIRQRDFGIQPISIAGGTVKVKDEIRIDFDIVTRR